MSFVDLIATPLAQDPAYHLFADQRTILGVPNFWNVASNLPFVIVGAWGFVFVRRHINDPLRVAWLVFFLGVFLTAFGSAYYHLGPGNDSLAWDRLAMTLGFMSFVAVIVGEYLSIEWGKRLLLPLLLVGAASVLYWLRTEHIGAGDLRPYALVQFVPMIFVPAVILVRRDRSDLGPYVAWMIAFYAAAKVLEHFDAGIFSAGEVMSGHALKHVFAALGPATLLLGLARRAAVVESPE